MICDVCGKEVKSLKIHVWKAHGPGVTHKPKTGTAAWNKGLTKETDTRVAKYGASTSLALKGKPGHPCSEETKKILSEKRKQYLEKHPDQVPYLLNHSSKRSFPEQYFSECFAKLINVKSEFRVLRYSLDFVNEVEKLYLEIDGEQHYVDSRIKEHDRKRTANLLAEGWVGIRVRWSEFQRLPADEKEERVKEIIDFMKWTSGL